MPASNAEQVLDALKALLETVTDAVVERNSVLPEKVPGGGLIILRDGDPGEPEQELPAGLGLGTGINHDGGQVPTVDATAFVDFGDREHDALKHGPLGDGHDALLREEHTDPDRLAVLAHDRPPAAPLRLVFPTLSPVRARATLSSHR
jgi:hypothetical protein